MMLHQVHKNKKWGVRMKYADQPFLRPHFTNRKKGWEDIWCKIESINYKANVRGTEWGLAEE
jgi:hypothetical protein